MNTEEWNRSSELFQKAIELPVTEQEDFLAGLDKTVPDLSDAVRNLVKAHYQAGTFLSGTVADTIQVNTGDRIGSYEIREQIGQGGMSTVYRATRADGQFEREVAVKFLHGLFPGKEMMSRLHKEQNILAQLSHANICRLLDAGVTENGRPYFIMEYVDGTSIDEYCSEHKLTVFEILDLFIQVLEAVQYAHQRLIVHRDLKPSNILVSKNGEVKLLDFGIAKIVSEDSESDVMKTKTGLFLMTPEYASPEQINNDIITTSSDIYSLGLILCKLLTGELPYNIQSDNPLEIGKVITATKPAKPSSIAADQKNGRSIESSQLKGDLDNIILKALRKDPEERYQSIGQMFQDLQNFRLDLPVSARSESATYRLRKFVKRHKVAVVVSAATLIFICASALVAIRQANIADEQREIAEQRLADIRDLTSSMMFEIDDALQPIPGTTPVREMIADNTIGYLDRLSELENKDVSHQLELASSYRRVGSLLGNPTQSNLGKPARAHENLNKSLALVNAALSKGEREELLKEKALILEKRGDVLVALGQLEQAKIDQGSAAELFDLLHHQHPESGYEFMKAVVFLKLGDLLGNPKFTNMGLPDSSLVYYTKAEDIFDRHYLQLPRDTRNVRFKGLIYERFGDIYDLKDQNQKALQHFSLSMEFRKTYAELAPLNTNAIRDLAVSHEKVAQIHLQQNNLEAAKKNYQESFSTFEWLAKRDSSNAGAIQSLAISHIQLGDLAYHPDQPSFGDNKTALHHFNESKSLLIKVNEIDSTNARNSFLMNLVTNRLSRLP